MSERIVPLDKSVIVAADVEAAKLPELVQQTCLVEGIGGYKVGLALALEEGLPRIVGQIKDAEGYPALPVIYDHQKAGNDIPETGPSFARVCRKSGVDAVILFPFAGDETQRVWTEACQEAGLGVLVGAHMTQEKFLQSDGGYIADDAPIRIFDTAIEQGVRNFVVPGNKLQFVELYRKLFEEKLDEGNFSLFSPGFIKQGGVISEYAQIAGRYWHAIVGSGIHSPEKMSINAAAKQMTSQLR